MSGEQFLGDGVHPPPGVARRAPRVPATWHPSRSMRGRIPEKFIDDLLARVDIVDVIQERVQLKKSGLGSSARCPGRFK